MPATREFSVPFLLPYSQWKSWRARIQSFTPAWHAVIMGTGVVSLLLHNFPYGTDRTGFQFAAIVIFLLNLVLFIFVTVCTLARYIMFPKMWLLMLSHPTQSLFLGCIPMGAVTLINSGVNVYNDTGFGGLSFLYFLWGCWWLDAAVSYLTAFGLLYIMVVKQEHTTAKMGGIWLLPYVTLVVCSSSGGLLAAALREHNTTQALITVGFSFTMLAIGLSFALMIITMYLMRLILHGTPDASLILSAFMAVGPLGQGGFSLLLNGQNMSYLLPLHDFGDFPQAPLAGQMIDAMCFCLAYVLWSMGIAWILTATLTVLHVIRRQTIGFSLGYWGLVFPNGVWALLSVEFGKILDSEFFRVVGALWSAIVFALWLSIFLRSIPPFIDGSMFQAPCLVNDSLTITTVSEHKRNADVENRP